MSKPGNMDQILPQIAFTNFKNAPTDAARADAWLDSVA